MNVNVGGPPPVYRPVYPWRGNGPAVAVNVSVSVSYDPYGNPLFNNTTGVAVSVVIADNATGLPRNFVVPPHGFVRPDGDWRDRNGYVWSAYDGDHFVNGGGFRPYDDCYSGGCTQQSIVQVYVQVNVNQPPVLVDAVDCGPGRIFVGNTVYVTGNYNGTYQDTGVPVFYPTQSPAAAPYSYNAVSGQSFSQTPPILQAGVGNWAAQLEQHPVLLAGATVGGVALILVLAFWRRIAGFFRRSDVPSAG